jgi:hypothetical protein
MINRKMINKQIIFLILALLFALISFPIINNYKEGFNSLSPGEYPVTVSEPILFNDYPTKDAMGVSSNTSEINSLYYPVFGSSYGQYTNNIRYWDTPDNGLCSRAEMCGGLYKNKDIKTSKTPNPIPFSSSTVRVNFYGSDPLICPN